MKKIIKSSNQSPGCITKHSLLYFDSRKVILAAFFFFLHLRHRHTTITMAKTLMKLLSEHLKIRGSNKKSYWTHREGTTGTNRQEGASGASGASGAKTFIAKKQTTKVKLEAVVRGLLSKKSVLPALIVLVVDVEVCRKYWFWLFFPPRYHQLFLFLHNKNNQLCSTYFLCNFNSIRLLRVESCKVSDFGCKSQRKGKLERDHQRKKLYYRDWKEKGLQKKLWFLFWKK